jgi:hypothetical protein
MNESVDISKKIIKTVRKELGIPENLDPKFYKLAENKYSKGDTTTVFVTQDVEGNILELSKKKGPFVVGQLLYSQIVKGSKTVKSAKSLGPAKSLKPVKSLGPVKSLKPLKPCPPGKIRNPETGRCVNEVKKIKKSKK